MIKYLRLINTHHGIKHQANQNRIEPPQVLVRQLFDLGRWQLVSVWNRKDQHVVG